MSSTETAMRIQMLLLKQPKRAWMKARLAQIKPDVISIQINNKVYKEPANQTVLQVARKHGLKIPFNCQAGICGACEAIIDGKIQKSCYTVVEDKMHVVQKSAEMSNWRQNMSDE
jgi:predicted molibdopterin-dependent oxidoreductase YjgC